jgi:hypothetical protein
MQRQLISRGRGLTAVVLLLTLCGLSCGKDETALAPFPVEPGMVLVGSVEVEGAGPAVGVAVSLEPMEQGLTASVRREMLTGAEPARADEKNESGPSAARIEALAAAIRVTTTDAAGRFAFPQVAAGDYLVTSSARDHRAGAKQVEVPALQNPAAAETTFVDIALVPTGTFTGSATLLNEADHGSTIVYVEDQANVAVTNAAGRYILRDVPVGARSLRATHIGWQRATASASLAAAGDSVEVAAMVLQPDLNIAPTASASAAAVGNTRHAFALTGTGTDTDGTIARYEWDFNDDGTIDWMSTTTGSTTYTYGTAGVYRAKLRVTDDKGGVALGAVSFRIYDAYYVATDGSDSNPGTRDLPLRTIQHGMDLAVTNDHIRVKVALGTYAESLTIPDQCLLEGGYVRASWIPSISQRSVVETGTAPMKAIGLTAMSISRLEVHAANATAGSSIALVVDNCPTQDVEFLYCRFVAGNGSAGAAGGAGSAGMAGGQGGDASGLWNGCQYGPSWGGCGGDSHQPSSGSIDGHAGDAGPAPLGGTGGAGGTLSVPAGGNGGAATAGSAGAHGAAATAGGMWNGSAWVSNGGNAGAAGVNGGVGGGGGGGLAWPGATGGGGGQGGNGGTGGTGGAGGSGGGCSFAVLVMNGSNCLFTTCDLVSANGGAAGAGGNGGLGAAGGAGGAGAPASLPAGSGGNGGAGAASGAGGGGSGGAGGWTYAIYARSGAHYTLDGGTASYGSAGAGSLGGYRGGTTNRAPSGPAGQAGREYSEP